MKVLIKPTRDGYTPEQCGTTMTIGELINELKNYPYNAPVYFSNDGGYTYGAISEYSLREGN